MPASPRKLYAHQKISPKLRMLFIGLTVLSCIGIIILSLGPATVSAVVTNDDKLAHGFAYFIFGLAALPAFGKMRIVYVWVLLSGCGGVIEIAQGAMHRGRKADIFDALANTSGVLLAILLWLALSRIDNAVSTQDSP